MIIEGLKRDLLEKCIYVVCEMLMSVLFETALHEMNGYAWVNKIVWVRIALHGHVCDNGYDCIAIIKYEK